MARGQGRQSSWDDLLDDYLEDEEIRQEVEEDFSLIEADCQRQEQEKAAADEYGRFLAEEDKRR